LWGSWDASDAFISQEMPGLEAGYSHFLGLNVGQGASFFSRTEKNELVIVDSGHGNKMTSSYFTNGYHKNVVNWLTTFVDKTQLIACVITHAHRDHFNLIGAILDEMKLDSEVFCIGGCIDSANQETQDIMALFELFQEKGLVNGQVFVYDNTLDDPVWYQYLNKSFSQVCLPQLPDYFSFLQSNKQPVFRVNAHSLVTLVNGVLHLGDQEGNFPLYNDLELIGIVASHHGSCDNGCDELTISYIQQCNPLFCVVPVGNTSRSWHPQLVVYESVLGFLGKCYLHNIIVSGVTAVSGYQPEVQSVDSAIFETGFLADIPGQLFRWNDVIQVYNHETQTFAQIVTS
jgi:hypothetical protein